MPLFTFLNLTEARQEEIRRIALEEFAGNFYAQASLTHIIKQLGISKGSFYRYFRNKLDLYAYLVDYATNLRTTTIEQALGTEQDFFEMMIRNLCLRIQFDRQYPLYGRFLNNIMHEQHSAELGNMMLKFKQRMTNLMREMMDAYQITAQLPAHISEEVMAFCLVQLQFGLADFLVMKERSVPEGQSAEWTTQSIETTVREFVNLYKCGMGLGQLEPGKQIFPAEQAIVVDNA